MHRNPVVSLVVVLLITLGSVSAECADLAFENVTLEAPERIRSVLTGDFDDDGDTDIAAFYVEGLPPAQSRMMTVFWQESPGRWERTEDSTTVIDDNVALVDVGRIAGRDRILFMQYDGILAVVVKDGRVGRTEVVYESSSIVFHGELGDVTTFDFALDLFGTGQTHLVIPQWGKLLIAAENDDGTWEETTVQVAQETSYIGGSIRHGFRQSDQSLRVSLTIPVFAGADVDGDGRQDLVMHRDDNVFVYLRDESGALPSWPTHATHFPVRTDEEKREGSAPVSLSVADIDGDGATDVVANKLYGGIRNMQGLTSVYLGQGDATFSDDPIWTLKDHGYASSVVLVELDGQPGAELVSPTASLGLLELSQVLLSGTMDLQLRVFDVDRNADDEPEDELDFEVLLDYTAGARLKSPDPRFADFDGDQRTDLLISRGSDTLEVYRATGSGFDRTPIAVTTVPLSRYVKIFDDGQDDHPDVLLFYPWDSERSRIIEIRLLKPQ